MFETILQTFGSEATAEKTDILTGLGIDPMLLVLQLVAFLILVGILAKFVYPVFMRIIDERQAAIEKSVQAAQEAEKKADEAEVKVEEALKKARSEAADIVATARAEAVQMIEKAGTDAKKRSDHIVSEAHESLEKDVLAARDTLKKDTLRLVKEAAGFATANVADSKLDSALIKKSLQEAEK